MRTLKRNEETFSFFPYKGKEEILKDGKHTGKFEVKYHPALVYEGNISTPSGLAQQQLFGIETQYTHVLLMDNPNAAISEDGLVKWKGSTYEVKAVRPSKNVLAVALKKRTDSNG